MSQFATGTVTANTDGVRHPSADVMWIVLGKIKSAKSGAFENHIRLRLRPVVQSRGAVRCRLSGATIKMATSL